MEKAEIEKLKRDILGDFQTLWICFCSRWVGSKTVSFLNINCGCRWSFLGARVLSSLSLLLSLPTPWLLSKFISSSGAWAARSSWLLHQLCKGIFFISHASQNASAIIVLLLYTTALLSAPFPTLLLGGELEIERFVTQYIELCDLTFFCWFYFCWNMETLKKKEIFLSE